MVMVLAAAPADAADKAAKIPDAPSGMPLPLDLTGIGEPALMDHFGNDLTLKDYDGKRLLVFFGYANCPSICSAALPAMGQTLDEIGSEAAGKLVPLMVTIDPERDRPEAMKRILQNYHPDLVGLTGSTEALKSLRKAFQLEIQKVGEDWDGAPIYAHGSFVYLLGPDLKLETVLPPVLSPAQMARIVRKYL